MLLYKIFITILLIRVLKANLIVYENKIPLKFPSKISYEIYTEKPVGSSLGPTLSNSHTINSE